MAGQERVVESFAPTNGQATGWFGVGMGVVVALGGLLRPDGGDAWPVVVAGALKGDIKESLERFKKVYS